MLTFSNKDNPMKFSLFKSSTLALVLSLMMISCSPSVYRDVYPTLVDGKYDSEFPYRGCSKQLEEISNTVKMISCIAYYKTYTFALSSRLTPPEVNAQSLRGAVEANYVNSESSGSATVISYQDRTVALLTCAHVIYFPDTVFTYHIDQDRHSTGFLKTVAIKEKQTNYVAVFPEGGDVDILAMDRGADIAIVGRRFTVEPTFRIPVFPYPLGKARQLEWGSFVYLFGYPSGYRMVTKGIVSSPNKDRNGSFLIDAVFSRGFSGGVALAVRDGVPNFELVGIIRMVTAHSSFVLAPEKDGAEYDPTVPYTGNMYVERRTDIEYGISQAISVESISAFIESHLDDLQSKGYYLGSLIKPS